MADARDDSSVVLLDTSVQVDRHKSKSRRDSIESKISGHTFSVSTSICLLEFKATLIQECITIHDNLRLKKMFTPVRDAMCEKAHRQARLRAHIFNNLICVFGSSFEVTSTEDERLAEKARLRLESVIPLLYRWFVRDSAGTILRDGINCTRAFEAPTKKRVAFGVNLPRCRRGENKDCNIEEFIRKHAAGHLTELAEHAGDSSQLQNALSTLTSVILDDDAELSVGACRSMGDCLIAMEAAGVATDVLSTNATEWNVLAKLFGYRFSQLKYPDEDTR